jgi:alkaline phosphatase
MIRFSVLFLALPVLLAIMPHTTQAPRDYTVADAHSHNDYKNSIPFYRAYNDGFGSIEADVYAVNGHLMVAHEEKEITPLRSLKFMYIDPLVTNLRKDTARRLRLLIEIKKDYTITLPLVLKELKPLRKYFSYPGHPGRLVITMTGAVPPGNVMVQYPGWLNFDVGHLNGYTPEQLKKIELVSADFWEYSKWNGRSELKARDIKRLKGIIDSAHAAGKKMRFYGTPDTPLCWKTMIELNTDVIGTDHVDELAEFLNKKAYR